MNEEKKLIEEARKKAKPQVPDSSGSGQDNSALLQSIIQMAGTSGGAKRDANLLTMLAAGGSRPKIQRTKGNSPCFACL